MMTGHEATGRNSTKSGFSVVHRSVATGQRGWKEQPSAGPRVGHVAADDDPLSTGRVGVVEFGHDGQQRLGVGCSGVS